MESRITKKTHQSAPAGVVYGLGFIGATVYFISTATSFWAGALGLLKLIV